MQNTSSTEIKIVSINGKEFVSGLVWEPLKERAYMREARQIGKRESMDIVAIRLGFMAQAGFVKKDNGVTKGMYSMASALAGQINLDAWIGAFELPNGLYALVAVHNGLIVPDCDLVGDRQEVLNLLKEMDSQPKVMLFNTVYHPADFDYRGKPLDIEDVLKPEAMRKDYALKQLTFGMTRRELLQLGGATVLLVCLVVGYLQWQAYETEKALKEAQRVELLRQQALAELNARAGAEQTARALQHPWATQPGIPDFLNGCQGAIDALPLAIGGWTFQSAICTPITVESVFGRSAKTTFNDFTEATRELFAAPPVLLEGGERAGLGDKITIGAGGDDELLPWQQIQADFMSYLQKLDLKAVITEVPVVIPAQPALPGGVEAPPLPQPDWKHFKFSLSSAYTPQYLFAGLSLKGIRLVEISVSREGSELTWTVKGDIYAN